MAKVTVIEIPQPKPPLKITLELDLEEAACIAQVTGMIANSGRVRDILSSVFHTLDANPRVSELRDKLDHQINVTIAGVSGHSLNIGHVTMPKED